MVQTFRHTKTFLSGRIFQGLRGCLPGAGQGPVLRPSLCLHCAAFKHLHPAGFTLCLHNLHLPVFPVGANSSLFFPDIQASLGVVRDSTFPPLSHIKPISSFCQLCLHNLFRISTTSPNLGPGSHYLSPGFCNSLLHNLHTSSLALLQSSLTQHKSKTKAFIMEIRSGAPLLKLFTGFLFQ